MNIKVLETCSGIAWDGCHKIYILMDDEQMKNMQAWGYDPLIWAKDSTVEAMGSTIHDWYNKSCPLRFISAVSTTADPNNGFTSIVAQFEDENDSGAGAAQELSVTR